MYLNKRINRLEARKEQLKPQDILFEAECGAMLARWPDLKVSFEEPDLSVTFLDGLRMLIACKRPRSLNSLAAT